MPVTIAHPAAVLPLRGLGLPLSAMVIGSMAPDLPVFTRSWHTYGFTHSAIGVVTVDLAMSLLLLVFWDRWGRDALVDTAPAVARDRLPAHAALCRRAWLLAPPAAVLGSMTHVVWDAFTHEGRWGVRMVPWLQEMHGPMRGEQWAQHGTSVLGLLVIGVVLLGMLRRPVLDPGRPRRLPAATLPAGLAVACLLSAGTFLSQLSGSLDLAVFDAAVVGIVSLAVVLGLVTLAWSLAPVGSRG